MADKQIIDFGEVALADAQNFIVQSDSGTVNRTPSEPIKQTVDDVVTLNSDVSTLQSDVSAIEILSRNNASTALIEGCELSINGGDPTTFDIAAGEIQVVDNSTDPQNPAITYVSFAGASGESVTNLATQQFTTIGIDNSGTIVEFLSPTPEEIRENAIVGILLHPSLTQIDFVTQQTFSAPVEPMSNLADLARVIGVINSAGNVFSPNGSNLFLDKSDGELYACGINTKSNLGRPNQIDTPSLSALTFTYVWRDGAGGFIAAPGITSINPANYDDDTGGAGTPNGAVGGAQITTQRIYLSPTNDVVIQYGQALYSSLAAAIDGLTTEPFVSAEVLQKYAFRGYLISVGSATDLSSGLQALFLVAGKFGDVGLSGVSFSTTTLQGAYDNSTNPEILTNGSQGALTVVDGTAGANNILDVQDASNVPMLLVKPDGTINLGNVQSGSGGLSTGDVYHTSGALQIVL